jgi:hypothetical protein
MLDSMFDLRLANLIVRREQALTLEVTAPQGIGRS